MASSSKVLLLVLALFGACLAVGWFGSSAVARIGAPHLECETAIDLGERELGEMVTRPIVLRNTGPSELRITGIRGTCACTGITRKLGDEYQRVGEITVPPSGQVEYFIRLRVVSEKEKESSYTVFLLSNDPDQRETAINLRVRRATPGLAVEPAVLSLGDSLTPEAAHSFQANVYDNPSYGRKIQEVVSTLPDWVKVRWEPITPSTGAGVNAARQLVGRLHVEARGPAATELFGQIVLRTDRETTLPVVLPFSGRIRPWLRLSPAQAMLPRRSEAGLLNHFHVVCSFPEGQAGKVEVKDVPPGLDVVREGTTESPTFRIALRSPEADKRDRLAVRFQWQVGERRGEEVATIFVNPAGSQLQK